MPRFDAQCPNCRWEGEVWAKPFEHPPCPDCGAITERIWKRSATVRDDSFIGGLTLENLDHEPVTVHSRTELKAELNKRGLQEFVRHVPLPGSDKSPYTTRWDAPSPYTLESAKALLERVATQSGTTRTWTPEPGDPTPELVKEIAESWR